ncbi:MAG: glycosyltransferase family 2 protein [Deltaproteobacteria bacterium]|nr:glycosyltransferase family 2 protein [Deltaproteobacteria bacterium]
MFADKSVAVVIPAYNEKLLIGKVVRSIPDFVDHIVVVDDCSTDETVATVEALMKDEPRLVLLIHENNQGVGGAIATGYKWARDHQVDVTAVMAADFQMDPDDLPRIVGPVCRGEYDYTKGNRLFRGESWDMIPKYRYIGNSFLSLFTKIASGYWHIADSQSGYTAISLAALQRLDLDDIYPRYGMPNDLLIKLNIAHFRVKDVSIRPIYNVGERSGIKVRKVMFTIPALLFKGFWRRMFEKYVIRDFHPLLFFYLMGMALTPSGLLFGLYLLLVRLAGHSVAPTSALFAAFLFITGLQSLFFAMWFDMEYNKELK